MTHFLLVLVGIAIGVAFCWVRQQRVQRMQRLMVAQYRSYGVVSGTSMEGAIAELARKVQVLQTEKAALMEQVQTLKPPLHIAPIGYLQIDDQNRLVLMNSQACQLLDIGTFEPDTVDSSNRLLLEMVRSYELDNLIEATRATQSPRQTEWLLHRISTDPSRIERHPPLPLRAYSVPLIQGQVGVFVESRREATELAQQRDRWASDVAHELKTPLTSIRLVAETLQSRVDPALQSWLDRLINETVRLSNLVQDLLDLSRLDGADEAALSLAPINLVDLIQRAWQSLEPLATKKHLQFDYEGVAELVIELDEARLFRVMLNLLDNAIKHSPDRGVIQVRLHWHPIVKSVPATNPDRSHTEPAQAAELARNTEPDDPAAIALINALRGQGSAYVELEVIDTGYGFRSNDLPYVFDRFYQVDPSRTRSPMSPATIPRPGSNSGLGLAIVQQIIEAHQGKVMAANHPETGGGWLRIYLPYQNREKG